MTEIWGQAALWFGLALVATLVSIWLRIATALSEIVVGTIAQLLIGATIGSAPRSPLARRAAPLALLDGKSSNRV